MGGCLPGGEVTSLLFSTDGIPLKHPRTSSEPRPSLGPSLVDSTAANRSRTYDRSASPVL